MTGHSFLIDTLWCEEHQQFEPMLRVTTVDTSTHARETPSTVYPLHHGGLMQLFLNVTNHVGPAYIPASPRVSP